MRDRVVEIDKAQRGLRAAVTESDGALRAERLRPYVQSDLLPARWFALDELGKAGPAAVSTICEMLGDPAFRDEAGGLIKALARAGGESVEAELNGRLHPSSYKLFARARDGS